MTVFRTSSAVTGMANGIGRRLGAGGEVEDRGVPRLDRVDRQGGGQDLLVLDVRCLAEVGAGAEVLDGRGELQDRLLVVEREVRLRRHGRLAAGLLDQRDQRVDVRLLLVAEALREVGDLALEHAAVVDLRVEVGLQVLERQGVVGDAEIALTELLGAALGAHRRRGGRGRLRGRLRVAATGRDEHGQRGCDTTAACLAQEPLARGRVLRELLHSVGCFSHGGCSFRLRGPSNAAPPATG